MKKITQRLVEKAGESRSLRYAARRARMRRERECRAAPVGMTVVDGGGRSKDGPYKDEPKTQGHTPCLGHPQFEEVGFAGGACSGKSGGPSKLPSKIGASRVKRPAPLRGKGARLPDQVGVNARRPLQRRSDLLVG